jgi:phage-related protein
MGTDIASIQNAYQGFAKQNYTMLDNLKLGYGGTKSEMDRLLADAEKISVLNTTSLHFPI